MATAVLGSADINSDDLVGIDDLLFMSQYWLADDCRTVNNFCNGADIDQLTTVDIEDFRYFSEQWYSPYRFECKIKKRA